MTLFLDIAEEAQKGKAKLRGHDVDVVGLSASQIARLLLGHKALDKFFDAKQPMNLMELLRVAPDAVAAAIAYGTGFDEQQDREQWEKARAKASRLVVGEQYDLLLTIFDVSFGERLNPFVQAMVKRVVERVGAEEVADTAAPRKARLTKSVKELKASLVSDTTPEMFGATHPGNSQVTPS